MGAHDRLLAEAHLARAEFLADILIGPIDFVKRPAHAGAASVPTRHRRLHLILARMTQAIAVQKLGPRHRGDIARHLIRLPAEDRRLRFGQPTRDVGIERYVGDIDFARDRVFAIYAEDQALAGVAHLALDSHEPHAELGLSVDTAFRGRGCGAALLSRGVLHAANQGYGALYLHCLSENSVMVRLAARAGLKTVVAAGEANARITLNHAHGGALREAMEEQFALVDYLLKQQVLLIGRRTAAPQSPGKLLVDEMAAR